MVRNRVFPLVLVMAMLVGAGLLQGFARSASAQEATISTRARVIHAATNEGEIKVSFNGDRQIEGLGFSEVSDFVEIDPGDVWVEMEEDSVDLFDLIFSATYPVVPAGNDYQLVLTDDLVLTQLVDTTSVRAGQARIRLVHASVNTPTVDVVVGGAERAIISESRYPFSTEYAEVDPGSYDLQFVQSGTSTVVLELPSVTIEEGMVYDLILAGTPGDDERPLQAILASTQAST